MRFPNAVKGVKKMFTAEILSIIASLAVFPVVFVFALLAAGKSYDAEFFGTAIAAALGIAVSLAGYILQIVGVKQACRDNPAFKVSFIFIFVAMAATFFEAIFGAVPAVVTITSIVADVAEFFIVHYIIHGIMNLSAQIGNEEMVKKGKNIYKVIFIDIGALIISKALVFIFGAELGSNLALPFTIIAGVFQLVEYILFVLYLGKAGKTLAVE